MSTNIGRVGYSKVWWKVGEECVMVWYVSKHDIGMGFRLQRIIGQKRRETVKWTKEGTDIRRK